MRPLPNGETREQLVVLARDRGYSWLGPYHLGRWHRAGLLDQPYVVHPGKPLGSQSIYPPGTDQRVLVLCELHEHDRRVERLAWGLWWRGYPMDVGGIRSFLAGVAHTWDELLTRIRNAYDDPDTIALLEKASEWRLSGTRRKVLRRARKRTGRAGFPVFVDMLYAIAVGAFPDAYKGPGGELDADQEQVLDAGLGVRRGRTDRMGDAGPWLTGGQFQAMSELSRVILQHPLSTVLSASSDDDLARARDEIRPFLLVLKGTGEVARHLKGEGGLGLTALADAIDPLDANQQAWLVLYWIALRSAFAEGMNLLTETSRQIVEKGDADAGT